MTQNTSSSTRDEEQFASKLSERLAKVRRMNISHLFLGYPPAQKQKLMNCFGVRRNIMFVKKLISRGYPLVLETGESVAFVRLDEARTRPATVKLHPTTSVPSGLGENIVDDTSSEGSESVDSVIAMDPLTVSSYFEELLAVLPQEIVQVINEHVPNAEMDIMDIVMDLERDLAIHPMRGITVRLPELKVSTHHLQFVLDNCGSLTDGNRACVRDTLHRCSVIKDPLTGELAGITLRMSRVVSGLAQAFQDILSNGSSVLLMGKPGAGKTTMLRDIARLLSSMSIDRKVMVVDTSNEIGGESTVAHSAIGYARRMKVGQRKYQHRVMLEAVQNHTPTTLVIDEIGTRDEVNEATSIRERGVQLIATTHGTKLIDVVRNPELRNLLGGSHSVILSAAERVSVRSETKTVIERVRPPTFDVCVEIHPENEWRVYRNVEAAVDACLQPTRTRVKHEVRKWDVKSNSLTTKVVNEYIV